MTISRLCGAENSGKLGAVLGDLLYSTGWRRKIALKNAEIIGVRDPEDTVRRAYRNFAEYFIEVFSSPPPSYISRVFDAGEMKNFSDVKNTIFISGHFGNWELATLYAPFLMKGKTAAIARRIKNPYINQAFLGIRQRFGLKIIYDRNIREFIRHLSEDGILFFLADQSSPSLEFTFPFFGVSATFYHGPFSLALTTSSDIIFYAVMKNIEGKKSEAKDQNKRKKYKIKVFRVFSKDEDGNLRRNKKDFIREGIKRYISLLEEVISSQPENYFLFHRRWKRPTNVYE